MVVFFKLQRTWLQYSKKSMEYSFSAPYTPFLNLLKSGQLGVMFSAQYITQVAKRGGGFTWDSDFFEDFFPKNRFLSDYVVGGCPKYIFGKLRSFLKISEKKFFKIFLLGDSKPNWLKVPNVKNHFCKGLKVLKIAWPAKKSIFSKSEISLPQSNHGKRNIKLMLVRP